MFSCIYFIHSHQPGLSVKAPAAYSSLLRLLYMKLCFIIYRAFGFVNCFSGRCLTLFRSQMPGIFFSGGYLFYRQVCRHFFTPKHSFSPWFETAHPLNGVPPDKKSRLTGLFPADGFSAPFFWTSFLTAENNLHCAFAARIVLRIRPHSILPHNILPHNIFCMVF